MISGLSKADDQILVAGRGFKITQDYMAAFQDYYQSAGFTTTEEEFLTQAIKIKVFSAEARSMGLKPAELSVDREEASDTDSMERIIADEIALAEAFVRSQLANHSLNDMIIESYYRSNPDKFREGTWSGADLIPLDNELRESIRGKIVNSVAGRLTEEFFMNIRDKYEIE